MGTEQTKRRNQTRRHFNERWHPERQTVEAELQQLQEWVLAGMFPEMVPTRQERSLRSALAMLDTGRVLLRQLSLDALSVEVVCSHSGTAIGAFYGRFENKNSFFITMQRLQILRSEGVKSAFIERISSDDMALDKLAGEMVDFSVANFRHNIGVLRASLKYADSGKWDLFKRAGDHFRAELARYVAPHLSWLPPNQRKLRVLAAYQMLISTLVHTAMTDPGPLALESKSIQQELTRMLMAYLSAPG